MNSCETKKQQFKIKLKHSKRGIIERSNSSTSYQDLSIWGTVSTPDQIPLFGTWAVQRISSHSLHLKEPRGTRLQHNNKAHSLFFFLLFLTMQYNHRLLICESWAECWKRCVSSALRWDNQITRVIVSKWIPIQADHGFPISGSMLGLSTVSPRAQGGGGSTNRQMCRLLCVDCDGISLKAACMNNSWGEVIFGLISWGSIRPLTLNHTWVVLHEAAHNETVSPWGEQVSLGKIMFNQE